MFDLFHCISHQLLTSSTHSFLSHNRFEMPRDSIERIIITFFFVNRKTTAWQSFTPTDEEPFLTSVIKSPNPSF